jgi:phage terminase large subunit-like protein
MRRAAGTLGPAVAEFAEGCLRIPEGPHEGEPFVFEPWQREITDIVYETDERDLPMWKVSVIGVPRGSGKSPLCGVYANHALVTGVGSPQVYCTAAAKSQAGIVHKHANKEARGGPLEDFLEFPRVGEALGPIKCPSTNGVLRVLSADGDLQQGLVPAFVAEDEPHTFRTGKQVGLHFAMTTALHKREDSRMVMITTAGSDKDSLLGELIDAIIANGEVEYRNHGCLMIVRDYEAKRLLIWYGAPEDADVSDPTIWRACNPASWITDESLRIAAASNPESEFRRFYLNQWVKGEDAAIQPGAWDACMVPGAVPPGSLLWVGVDMGGKRDAAAVSWACPRPNGKVRVGASVFMAADSSLRSAAPLVEAELRRLATRYMV